MIIQVTNHGGLILRSNYWESPISKRGLFFCSVNAGAIRVLVPPQYNSVLGDMRAAKACVLSRGPWPDQHLADAVEIMWDDGSDSPFALHLTPESFDMLPAEPEPGREWVCDVYVQKDGIPHRSLTRRCHWRRVPRIPWLKPWGER